MITKTIAAGLIAVSTLAAVPANAAGFNFQFGHGPSWGYYGGHDSHYRQGYDSHYRQDRLSPDEVQRMLRRDGYWVVRFYDAHGPVYQLRARKHGDEYVLVVSARTGEILSRHRV
jgi:hypothetical protein